MIFLEALGSDPKRLHSNRRGTSSDMLLTWGSMTTIIFEGVPTLQIHSLTSMAFSGNYGVRFVDGLGVLQLLEQATRHPPVGFFFRKAEVWAHLAASSFLSGCLHLGSPVVGRSAESRAIRVGGTSYIWRISLRSTGARVLSMGRSPTNESQLK